MDIANTVSFLAHLVASKKKPWVRRFLPRGIFNFVMDFKEVKGKSETGRTDVMLSGNKTINPAAVPYDHRPAARP
ncbi:hypothetical protein [Citrobacter amalonaticus]|uniref:hypothetical protein n=1 Tax=Citrobacter amalonaticus TaxID=35703 RepID=UPI0015E1959A|nr:hypothetical protein [Citrobacter amalonaticus]